MQLTHSALLIHWKVHQRDAEGWWASGPVGVARAFNVCVIDVRATLLLIFHLTMMMTMMPPLLLSAYFSCMAKVLR